MTHVKGSGEDVVNVMLPTTLFSMVSSMVGQRCSVGAFLWRDAQTCTEVLDMLLDPNNSLAGPLCPGFLTVHDNAQPSVGRVCL